MIKSSSYQILISSFFYCPPEDNGWNVSFPVFLQSLLNLELINLRMMQYLSFIPYREEFR